VPGAVRFLDCETTQSVAGEHVVCLVGVLQVDARGWSAQQWGAPAPELERALLAELVAHLRVDPSPVVTWNGASFDLPVLRRRARRLGPWELPSFPHVDALPAGRRLFAVRCGNARLATLEAALTELRRVEDLPSREIPARIQEDWRARGRVSPDLLLRVADHNLVDLVALAIVAQHVARGLQSPASARDLRAVVRHRWSRGDLEGLVAVAEAAWERLAQGATAGGGGDGADDAAALREVARSAARAARRGGQRALVERWRARAGLPGVARAAAL
jgi:hypothetical protein